MGRELPPVAELANSEKLWAAQSPADLETRLTASGLGNELARQAQWTVENHSYGSPDSSGFLAAPSGSLNPFSGAFKCQNLQCRLEAADDFVKTVALYVDQLVIPDPLTAALAEDKIDYERLHAVVAVYRHVLPLVEAGVIVFSKPFAHYCKACANRADFEAGVAAERILTEAEADIKIHVFDDKHIGVSCPVLFADARHPLVSVFSLDRIQGAPALEEFSRGGKRARDLLKPILADKLKRLASNALFELTSAQKCRATVLARARAELLCFTDADGRRPPMSDLEEWEDERSIQLPWIKQLTPEECLILRSEARSALPKLRAVFAESLASDANAKSPQAVVADLRSQVADVEAEIQSVKQLGEGRYRLAVNGLGLAMVVYGLSTGVPAVVGAGLAGLLAAMAHVQSGARDLTDKNQKIASAPAFALVTAKEIIKRRSH